MATVEIGAERPAFVFSPSVPPVANARMGDEVVFRTAPSPYEAMTGAAIDTGRVRFDRVNVLTGPVFVEGARPGDAIGLSIGEIELDVAAYVVYVARWRGASFGLARSSVMRVAIVGQDVVLPNGGRIAARPMVGCVGIAPAAGAVSALSPCGPTGGNMDLVELGPGATIWLPCQVDGALLSLGDLHVRMGRGEPVGAGLECGGVVRGTVRLADGRAIDGPVVVTPNHIWFVGTHENDRVAAERVAVQAAWRWLIAEDAVDADAALAICAGLLEVNNGGPAGANVLAGFERAALGLAGIAVGRWPLVGS